MPDARALSRRSTQRAVRIGPALIEHNQHHLLVTTEIFLNYLGLPNLADLRAKVELYMSSGVRLVWLVDPRTETVEEVRAVAGEAQPAVQSRVLRGEDGDVLEDADVLPGFHLSVADVFA